MELVEFDHKNKSNKINILDINKLVGNDETKKNHVGLRYGKIIPLVNKYDFKIFDNITNEELEENDPAYNEYLDITSIILKKYTKRS